MDSSSSGEGVGCQGLTDGLGDGLGPRERFHVHRVDVENVAGWERTMQTLNGNSAESFASEQTTYLKLHIEGHFDWILYHG